MILRRSAVVALIAALAPLVSAQTYNIDPARSKIAFSVGHLLGTARGEFHQFGGTINVNHQQPEKSSVSATIQAASLDTQIRRRDDHLLSAEFFDVKRFPTITFQSREIERTGPESGDIRGELTMKGTTRPLTLHVKLLTDLHRNELPRRTRWLIRADAISRKDFGLMFGSTAEALSGIGQQVTPSIQIEAVRE